jgi:hypothetical protein
MDARDVMEMSLGPLMKWVSAISTMRTLVALISMVATSVYGHEPTALTLCDVTGASAHKGADLRIRSHITPTMHAGLQLSDGRCPDTLIKLESDESDVAQRAALSKAFEARLYARPYSVFVVGRLETRHGETVVVASSLQFSPGDPK